MQKILTQLNFFTQYIFVRVRLPELQVRKDVVVDCTLDCGCDSVGTLAGAQCDGFGGQCTCKPGVAGRTCARCALGYFNFTDAGCTRE